MAKKFGRFLKLRKKKVNSRRNDFKMKTQFKKCEEVSSHVEKHVPNFTSFGASYVEDEDEGKMALNINSNVQQSVCVAQMIMKAKRP